MCYRLNTNGCSYVIEKDAPSRDGVGPGFLLAPQDGENEPRKRLSRPPHRSIAVAATIDEPDELLPALEPASATQHVRSIMSFDWHSV
jgi:hypothetical protein